MRVLWLSWKDLKHPTAGGAEYYTYHIAKRLSAIGWENYWICVEVEGEPKSEEIDGINIIRTGTKYTIFKEAKKIYKSRFEGNIDIIIDVMIMRPFQAVKYAVEPVILLVHQLARECWFMEQAPLPIALAGYLFLEKMWLKPYRNRPTIAVSKSTCKDLKRWGFKNIKIIYNGLNIKPLDAMPRKRDRPTLIFLGRMSKAKKPMDAVRAFKIIREEIPECELWMVGEGYLRAKIESMNISGLKVFGRVSEKEKVRLLSQSHILLFPGVREGWGLTVMEANACWTPAIAYNVPGLCESIRHMETGILVPKNDVRGMAEAAIQLLQDKRLYMNLCREARNWAGKFSWNKTAKEFKDFIEEIISSA